MQTDQPPPIASNYEVSKKCCLEYTLALEITRNLCLSTKFPATKPLKMELTGLSPKWSSGVWEIVTPNIAEEDFGMAQIRRHTLQGKLL